MKCQHGNTVQVVVETNSPVCWDDGIVMVNRNGKDESLSTWIKEQGGAARGKNTTDVWSRYYKLYSYLPITGCPKCKAIKIGG